MLPTDKAEVPLFVLSPTHTAHMGPWFLLSHVTSGFLSGPCWSAPIRWKQITLLANLFSCALLTAPRHASQILQSCANEWKLRTLGGHWKLLETTPQWFGYRWPILSWRGDHVKKCLLRWQLNCSHWNVLRAFGNAWKFMWFISASACFRNCIY